jgi:hypothetical protein
LKSLVNCIAGGESAAAMTMARALDTMAERPEWEVSFCRYRFSPTGDLGYSGIRGAEG